MQREVSEFIVVAPVGMEKAIEWAEPQLRSFLAGHFPFYSFRIEPYGPFAEEEDFAIIPIMNRRPAAGEMKGNTDEMLMCHLDPNVIPEIRIALRAFDPATPAMH